MIGRIEHPFLERLVMEHGVPEDEIQEGIIDLVRVLIGPSVDRQERVIVHATEELPWLTIVEDAFGAICIRTRAGWERVSFHGKKYSIRDRPFTPATILYEPMMRGEG